ncbi:carcinoembryonic antigen-related cell adhesion molecule 5 [Dunckerocampus dactyliophorus]|uniref:carcinoembryonic antigen-related cell adhesion molecule 5 n=1 Tax=Dunckerocampus dactyliophorus TaxID=161453 RepID=UPI00240699ED|nr:carcinoembryonic antigen-related cell adhesion molecule 5 [Dunckerocampus dactyliophorus]
MTSVVLLIILGVLSGSSHGAGVLPDSLVAIVGNRVIFNTTVTPPPTPFLVITWNVMDVLGTSTNVITSSSVNVTAPAYKDRITLFTHTGSLELRNVTLRDSGDYKVTIIPAGGTQQRGTCRLQIHEPVTNVVLVPSTTDLLESTSSVTMSCSYSTGSGLSFLWLNGSSEITASNRIQFTDGGSKLTIVGVTRFDQGPFKCHVFNIISNGTSNPVNLSISYGPDSIHLATSPSLEYYKKGSNIKMSCSASSRPPAFFQWFHNGEPLTATGPQLRLRNVQENQSGNYSCHASNNKTQKYQTQLSAITIVAPISFVEIKANTTDILEFSGSVSLSCSYTGSSPSFVWLNSSSEVTVSENVKITNGGSVLTIVNVTRYDQGPFRCHVVNPVSNGTSKPVNLSISFGPENMNLTRSPSQEHYDEGSDIILVCSVVSGPPPLFRWFRNGDLLSHTIPKLQLMRIQMHQSGNYSCQAFNNKTLRNQTSAPVAISVRRFLLLFNGAFSVCLLHDKYYELRDAEISNVVIIASTTDVTEFSSSVRLSCSSSGSFPRFAWRNGSAELTVGERVQINDKGDVVTLINVTRYDEGPFRCLVFNNFSNSTSQPVKISINYGPEGIDLKLSPPQEYFARGSNISLSCSAASRPPALFQWFFNGDLLSNTRPVLKLRNVKDNQSGNYSCRAFNKKTQKDQTSQPSSISIQSPVSNVVLTSNITVMFEFHSVTMSCSFSTGSELSFLWSNGSSEVMASERVQFTDGGSKLTIVNVTRFDQGPYRCNLSNGISDGVSRPVHLFIQYGPDSLTIEGPDSVHIGQHTMLHCSIMSVPTASFTWLFNGNAANVHGPVYVIESSRSSDAGKYTCTAQNAITGKSVTGHHELAVLAMCTAQGILPPGPLSGAVSGTVTFTTTLEPPARPFLSVSWTFKGANIITSTSSDIIGSGYEGRITLDRSTGSLVLTQLTIADSGEYLVTITPDGGLQMPVSGATIRGPTTILIEDKHTANVTCEASGSVSSRVWTKDGLPLHPRATHSFSADNSTVSFRPVHSYDHGSYQCRVSNPISAMTAALNLIVNFGPHNMSIMGPSAAPPGHRVTLTCKVYSFPPATFSWLFNDNTTHVNSSSYVIERLDENSEGNYTCTARNAVTRLENSSILHLRGHFALQSFTS